jgi:hypothetical protein
MSVIGKLAVSVLGNVSDFQKNFNEAKKGVGDFQKTVQRSNVDLKKMGSSMTLIGAAIVGSLTAVTLQQPKVLRRLTYYQSAPAQVERSCRRSVMQPAKRVLT